MNGFMYILQCALGYYYTGSTIDLERRLKEHNSGQGANFTKKHLPVDLVYYESYERIEDAFYREKQVQGWSRRKKEALINGNNDQLKAFSKCLNQSHFRNKNKTKKNKLFRTFRLRLRNKFIMIAPFDSAQGAD